MKFNYRFFPGAAVIFGLAGASLAGEVTDSAVSSAHDNSNGPHWELTGGFGVRQAYDMTLGAGRRDLTGGALGSFGTISSDSVFSEDGEYRVYDDGFVKSGSTFGMTSEWGYTNAGQIRPSSQEWPSSQPWDQTGNNSLYLSKSGIAGIDGFQRSSDIEPDLYPYLELKRLWANDDKSAERGWVASWSWVPGDGRSTQDLSLVRASVVDEYYLYGITPPGAPYSGPALPPGPLLDNAPQNSVVTDSVTDLVGLTRTKAKLDLNSLSFGGIWRWLPKQEKELNRVHFFGADLQAGMSLNIADLKVDSSTDVYRGVIPVGGFDEHASKQKFCAGFYASLGANFDLNYHDWFINTQARYDDAGSITARSGQSWATVDLDGWSLMLGLTKRW